MRCGWYRLTASYLAYLGAGGNTRRSVCCAAGHRVWRGSIVLVNAHFISRFLVPYIVAFCLDIADTSVFSRAPSSLGLGYRYRSWFAAILLWHSPPAVAAYRTIAHARAFYAHTHALSTVNARAGASRHALYRCMDIVYGDNVA